MEQAPSSPMLKFGPYLVDLAAGEVRKNGSRIRLQEKPLRVLGLLAERQGQLVTREELQKRLWPDDTFVDFETGLNTAVSKLRDALSDSAETPRYIETIPRRGYRFLSSVEVVRANGNGITPTAASVPDNELESDPIDADPIITKNPGAPKRLGVREILLYGSIAAIVLLALSFGRVQFKGHQPAPQKVFSQRQLTHSLSDDTINDAEISPDGKYLAFTDFKGLHLTAMQSGESHDIALPEELRKALWTVTWFPNGEKLIIQTQSESEGDVLWLTSIFGGLPRKLRTDGHEAKVSPSGSSIAFISGHGHEIWLAGPDGENARKILDNQSEDYQSLAWAASGHRLAYIKRSKKVGLNENLGGSIETIALDGGSPTVLLSDPDLLHWANMVWLLDGRLIFTSTGGGELGEDFNLWAITADVQTGLASGKPMKITNWSAIVPYRPSVTSDGSRLVVAKDHQRTDVYVGDLRENGTRLDSPKPLTLSDSHNGPGAWTRDSETVFFASDRTGRYQIFKQQLGAETAEPLVNGRDDQLCPSFSAEAAWILYWSSASSAHGASSEGKSRRLMRVPASGGSPELVLEASVDPMIDFGCPSRSSGSCVVSRAEHDTLVFYDLDPLHGQGKEVIRSKLGQANDLKWSISPDGSRIATASWTQLREQIRLLDLQNGTQRNLQLPKRWAITALSWAADGNALFASVASNEKFLIARIDLDGTTHVLLERKSGWVGGAISSPDGRHLAYFQQPNDSNAWLLESF